MAEYEIGRLISYITAQCHSKKKMKPKDIIEFNWEKSAEIKENIKKNKARKEKLQTKENIERLLKQTHNLQNKIVIPQPVNK